jgi:hypothetical protein
MESAMKTIVCEGETMTISAMVTYAYDQFDQARTELDAVSE